VHVWTGGVGHASRGRRGAGVEVASGVAADSDLGRAAHVGSEIHATTVSKEEAARWIHATATGIGIENE
jgi:hypothetical protein